MFASTSHALDALRAAARLAGHHSSVEEAGRIQSRLAEQTLEVAVVGELKRGKSSLIDALVGRDVLPVGVLPLTAVPTFLETGDERLRVTFVDGRAETRPIADVGLFVTEDDNPRNRLGVASAVLTLRAPLLDMGVRLVDTPGVGSVFEHETESTNRYLPRLDAAILVLSADPPISLAETAFLRQIMEHAIELFVVLNKADYLSEEALERTVAFTEDVIRRHVPGWSRRVFPLSARPESGDNRGLISFHRELMHFLEEKRAATLQASMQRSASRLTASLRTAVDLEERAASLSLTEIKRKRAALQVAIERSRDEGAEDRALLGGAVERSLQEMDGVVALREAEFVTTMVEATVKRAQDLSSLAPRALLERLRDERPALLEESAQTITSETSEAALATYERAVTAASLRVWSRLDRFTGDVAETFGVALPAFDPPPLDTRAPAINFTYVRPLALGDQLHMGGWRLLGAARGRERAMVKARAEAAQEARMYLGRLRGQVFSILAEQTRTLIARFSGVEEQLLHSLLGAVERGAALVDETSKHRRARSCELRRVRALLDEAGHTLNNNVPSPGGSPGATDGAAQEPHDNGEGRETRG